MKKNISQHWLPRLYPYLPLMLFLFQLIFTLNSFSQIRYEELAESVRNPFWISQGYIYDGISGSVAWYGLEAVIYNLIGFSLHTAKFLRLVLSLISLVCLAAILKRFLGEKKAILPLLVIGLSPTLLYFNTLQTTYGMDLQYFPICLFLLLGINFDKKVKSVFMQFLFGFVSMIAWLSYPTFIFYLIPLAIFYISRIVESNKKFHTFAIKPILITLWGFLLPLIIAFAYIKNREWLIYDPYTKSGLFRGAGVLQLDFSLLLRNLKFLLENLFQSSYGYYFEVNQVDFSGWIPILPLLLIFILSFRLLTNRKYKFFIYLVLLTILLNLSLVGFSLDSTPGIRRYTPALASIYVLFVFVWVQVLNNKKSRIRFLFIGILLIFLLHHLIVYPINLSYIKNPSLFKDNEWFAQAETPTKSLNVFVEKIQKEDLSLACLDKKKQFTQCRYSEIYAAIAGSCLWNRLYCHEILGYDLKSKSFIPLSIDLWNSYQFSH